MMTPRPNPPETPSCPKTASLSREELVSRLAEAEQALHAIRSGEVDAIIVDGTGGEKIFTIEGADYIYRVFVERMNEGAAILGHDHTVLHCNGRFARLLGVPIQSIIGSSLHDLVCPADRSKLATLLGRAAQKPCRGEIRLQSKKTANLPVRLSLNPLNTQGPQAVCLIASDLTEVKRAEQELRASGEQLRNFAARLVTVREEERTRISREIHDELGQQLTAVKMDLAWITSRLSPDDTPILDRVRATLKLADNLIKTVRRISTDLRPGILDLGLAAAVEWQAQEFQTRSGIQCQLDLPTQEVEVEQAVSTALFRIFQETLTNIARHAEATEIDVALEVQRDRSVLRIADNGRGFDQADAAKSKSLGLLGMRERAAMLGGRVDISSIPGQGTIVTASIPLRSSDTSSSAASATA